MVHVLILRKHPERRGVFIGRLGDLGLGNPEGIPSKYAELSTDELNAIAEKEAERLIEPTDLTALACIDGRQTLGNADGSAPVARLRRVGASASNLAVALNAEASIVDTLPTDVSLGGQIEAVDQFVASATGFERSAHLGGCGGANGEVDDDKAIALNPAVLSATRTLFEIPEVKEYFAEGYDDLHEKDIYDETLAEKVRATSEKTAQFLDEAGWNGQAYVDGVVAANPHRVEDIKVGHDKFHGHDEPLVAIIIGDKTVPPDFKGFAWNLKASKEVARVLAGQRGTKGYQQALIAEVAKHMAVCDRLPSDKAPVVLLVA